MLPTAHKEFWKGKHYERGGPDDVTWKQYSSRPRYPKHIELLHQTKRVVVTYDHFDHKAGIWHRDATRACTTSMTSKRMTPGCPSAS